VLSQVLVDPEELNDWQAQFTVDVAQAREEGRPTLVLLSVAPVVEKRSHDIPEHLPIRAATEIAIAHGLTPDRCDILQNGSTLVLRLTETLVARVVQDSDGPRRGTEWFARENAIAQHLTKHGAPVIPLHPDLPPGPHEHLGYPMNFWNMSPVWKWSLRPARSGAPCVIATT